MEEGLLSARPSINASSPSMKTTRRDLYEYGPAHKAVEEEKQSAAAPQGERLQCLDAVRGLNVMLMILVDNCCTFPPHYRNTWIDHSPWDSIHLADFVMPLFLFMVRLAHPQPTPQTHLCDSCSVTDR